MLCAGHLVLFPSLHVIQVTDPHHHLSIFFYKIKCVVGSLGVLLFGATFRYLDIAIKKVNIGLAQRGAAAVSAQRV